jgi:hypothetical protein
MRTRFSAADQLGALGAEEGWDPYAIISKLQEDKARREQEAAEHAARLRAEEYDYYKPIEGRGPNQGMKEAAEREGLQASIAQSRAMSGPAPTRMMHGPGVIMGPTLDPLKMTGAQRRVHLPGSAVAGGGGLFPEPPPDAESQFMSLRDPWGDIPNWVATSQGGA